MMFSQGPDGRTDQLDRTDLSVKPSIATESPGVKLGLNHVATKIILASERQGQENSVLTLY